MNENSRRNLLKKADKKMNIFYILFSFTIIDLYNASIHFDKYLQSTYQI